MWSTVGNWNSELRPRSPYARRRTRFTLAGVIHTAAATTSVERSGPSRDIDMMLRRLPKIPRIRERASNVLAQMVDDIDDIHITI